MVVQLHDGRSAVVSMLHRADVALATNILDSALGTTRAVQNKTIAAQEGRQGVSLVRAVWRCVGGMQAAQEEPVQSTISHSLETAKKMLIEACDDGNVKAVRAVLAGAHGREVMNAKNALGNTGLSRALFARHEKVAKLLLATPGIDVNVRDEWGRTALHYLSYSPAVRWLLAAPGIDVNARDFDGRTPLMGATGGGSEERLQLLLSDSRVDVNARDNDGNTALHHANTSDTCKMLLSLESSRIDVNAMNHFGMTPLHRACKRYWPDIAEALLTDARVDVNAHKDILSDLEWKR